ncbi:MAG: uncharacterized protein conserved in archaea [halophilic archaeon J07HX5]|nr:MAG: uncharacterized protein conserved in archaea [halophilic archaeon J07HX5]
MTADQTDPRPEGDFETVEINIGADNVSGERFDLVTDLRLYHTGVSEDVTVELRAVGLNSGLTEASETVAVGSVERTGELAVNETLNVERAGGYQLEAVVFQGSDRGTAESKTVRGTGALTPGYPDSPVAFLQFPVYDLPVIDYQIVSKNNNIATLDIETYLTNSGDGTAEDLTLRLKARQVESGVVAAEQSIPVGAIGPEETARPGDELTVPSEYNYYLDATLWNGNQIVDTTRAGASLDPTERVQANATQREVAFELGDFTDDGGESSAPPGERTGAPADGDGGGPGFGVGVAIIALAVGIGFRAQARVNTGKKDD